MQHPVSLIFDLDGTLIDSRQDLANAVNAVRTHYGLASLPLETVVGYVGDGAKMLLHRSLSDASGIPVAEAEKYFRQSYLCHLTVFTTLYSGVSEGIKQLFSAGFKLAVATNKPQIASEEILKYFELFPYLSKIIGGGDLPLKPDPASLHAILRHNHSDPVRSWMIGDHHTDLSAGYAAGMNTCWASYGFGDPCGLTADLTVGSFSELVSYFLKNS